jgi:hypothetical protein
MTRGPKGEEFLQDLPEDFALKGFIERGEDHVPAEDEVKQAVRCCRAVVLFEKFHCSPNRLFHAVPVFRFDELSVLPFPGKLAHAAWRISSFLRPFDHAPGRHRSQ